MDSFASAVAGLLAGLPTLGTFLKWTGPLLLALAGVPFALRNTRALQFLRSGLDRALGGLLVVILLAMVFLSGLQILARNLFNSGILWIDPLLRHLVLALAFTGAVVATGTKRHVQINALGRLLRGTALRVGGTLIAAASGTICLAMAHASLALLREEIEFVEVVFLGIPTWVIILGFPVAFLVLAFRFSWLTFAEIAGEAPRSPEAEIEIPEPQETT